MHRKKCNIKFYYDNKTVAIALQRKLVQCNHKSITMPFLTEGKNLGSATSQLCKLS